MKIRAELIRPFILKTMKLQEIKGFGEKRIAKLASNGIYDPLDLLMIFPEKYYDKNAVIDWNSLSDGSDVIFKGRIISPPVLKRVRRNLSYVKVTVDAGREIICTWFNQPFITKALSVGSIKIISGKVKKFAGRIEISAPQIISDQELDVIPIYKPPKGLSQSLLIDGIKTILSKVRLKGFITQEIADKHNLLPLHQCFINAHFPRKIEDAITSRNNIALENLAYTISVYGLAKANYSQLRETKYVNNLAPIKKAIEDLPFTLTLGQQKAISNVINGLLSEKRLNLLLQGDVGSGKTIVALISAYFATLSGYQCAIMAPTEILATQHYEKAREFFSNKGKRVGLLIGSQKKEERLCLLEQIKKGDVDVVIGTHAIINNAVEFASLSLTITDEQHRFGVCQRGSLENKAHATDNIVMTATPIPRTLALSLYGQLDTVTINERPNENKIKTVVVPQSRLNDMYKYVENKAFSGEKTYIVCPRVESDSAVSAVTLYDELKKNELKNVKIGLLYGGQKESEKDAIMKSFATDDVMVLVSTTVIEVGIDVKEATTMVLFGAEYFGLSQLHQLRGRIGRNGQESYCFIVCEDKPSERIEYFKNCNDGFKLAEYDFNSRGAGDFIGIRQHGKSGTFGININAEFIKKAKEISNDLLAKQNIRAELQAGSAEKAEFIKSLSLN
ncbi:MAG: ATP-dependent DNA helicase RecG [Clostridia bacterium]|nr:ATP-dependent DNA helicase RecG [Clostridia bacterium]